MSFFPDRTTFVSFGTLQIKWYAILILTGALIAYYFSKRNLKECKNIDVDDFFDDCFLYMLWGGVIGARLWFCLFNNFTYYFSNPLAILRVWDGGVAFHGCFFGGALAAILFCKKRNVSFIRFADSVIPTILVAQALGRWGNFINQECHGVEVSESYFDGILAFLKDGMCIKGVYYMPLFFYESCLCLLGFFIINFGLRKTATKRGQLSGAYLIWYGVVRFFIEQGRTDSLMIGSLKTAQVTSIIYVIIGLLLFLGFYEKIFKRKKPTLIFDFDGTLIDSSQIIIDSFKDTFEKYGKVEDFTIERQIEVLGPPIKEMFMKYFPNENVDEVTEYYRECNRRRLKDTLKPIEHAVEVTKSLKAEGYHLGIFTTRTSESALDCLKICGFEDNTFEEIMGLNEVKEPKPNPEGIFKMIKKQHWNSGEVIMIGDSMADVEAGQNYGAYTVAYLVLEAKKQAVVDKKPNRVITDLNELLDIVKEDHYFTYNLK